MPKTPIPFNPESNKVSCPTTYDHYSDGAIFDTDQWDYNIRIFPLVVSLNCIVSAIIQLLLKPLGETPVVAQIMTGIIIGMSGLSQYEKFQAVIFPTDGGTFLTETLGNFGCMVYIFLVGVKMDLSILKRSSRKERAIGILTFILPLLLTVPVSFLMEKIAPTLDSLLNTDVETIQNLNLSGLALMTSTSSFHVIACFLTDLNILNTELGRVATSASTISGICSWITVMITSAVKDNQQSTKKLIWLNFTFSALAQIIFITLVLRAVVIWMIKQTPQGECVKEAYLFVIYLMVLGTGLIGEICGQHFVFGPMILGLAIPNGPPIGSALVDKLDALTSVVFLPLYFCQVGYRVDLQAATNVHWWTAVPLCVLGFLGKFIATLIVCLFYRLTIKDASILGLTLSTLGLVDVHNYRLAMSSKVIVRENFSIMVILALGLAGVIAPIVHFFYNPARRYIVHKKRTIQNLKPNAELRILICIYNAEIVPTIVNILQASNPTKDSPLIIFLLHLVELVGRSTPLLISHKPQGRGFNNPTPSDRIINSFRILEKKYQNVVLLHPFTCITPFSSAQEDICTVALDKRTYFLIIPFHKQWNIDGTTQTYHWKNTNKRILKQAPCSVGILIDRGVLNGARSVLSSWSTYNIAAIFLGDADDREALCYAMRMARNPNVNLTVYRLIASDYMTDDVTEKMLDENVINDYKFNNKDIESNLYKEEEVRDAVGIINVIQTMENSHDLILVGRSHSSYHSLFSNFIEWNEFPELGFFGDMLASTDFNGKASVLIVQQHSSTQMDVMHEEKCQSYNTNTWR